MTADVETLRRTYQEIEAAAGRFLTELKNQVNELVAKNNIVLGVPLEGRVKSWDSLVEKLDRKSKSINSVTEIDDLIGLRVIVLFRSSLSQVIEALKENFSVISFEDTAIRLGDTQFGYQSQHLILKMPEHWFKIPTFSGFSDLRVEVQVRTVAQHIWAAASHKLQYKQEANVPPPLKRTIHRISALLETADLELDRVQEEKLAYAKQIAEPPIDKTPLNVDLLESVLDDLLDPKAKYKHEDFPGLLSDLMLFGIKTTEDLRSLILSTKDEVAALEKSRIEEFSKTQTLSAPLQERRNKGVFLTFTGLARGAIRAKFGDGALKTLRERHMKGTEPD